MSKETAEICIGEIAMTLKRLWVQFRLLSFGGGGYKRTEYARKKGLYAEIGENSAIPTGLPLYPQLVRIHNNVTMHRTVKLVTHDYVNGILMGMSDAYHFKNAESLNPIEIFDNVYIGMDSIILGNVKIGPNVIINAGSLVTKDIPPNSVVGGVPAKVVGDFDKYVKLRVMMDKAVPYEVKRNGKESIDQRTVEMAWARFDSKKNRVKT